jgi:Cysteine rich repeat
MIRTLTLAFALTAGSAAALAYSGTEQEQNACRRDVVRHCRTVASEGEFVILACLQAHRPRLTSACRTVLESHGQ